MHPTTYLGVLSKIESFFTLIILKENSNNNSPEKRNQNNYIQPFKKLCINRASELARLKTTTTTTPLYELHSIKQKQFLIFSC